MLKSEPVKYYSVFMRILIIIILLSACTKKDKPLPPDTSPPYIKSIVSLDTTKLLVSFNETLNDSQAIDTMNYIITSYETLDVHLVNIDPMKMNCILITEPQESTFYEINIRDIEDISGNRIKDTTLTFFGIGVQVDSFAPSVRVIDPVEGDTLYGFEYISVNATDNTGVKRVSFFINDSLIETDKYFPYYCILDVRDFQEGEIYKVYATAEDYSANIGFSDTLNVFIGFHPSFPYVIIDTIYTARIPFRADITEDGTKLFFVQVDSGGHDLVMLNTETNSIERTTRFFTGTSYFLDVFENNQVYFTTGSSFAIYDIFLNQIIETIDVGGCPQGIVRSNNEKLYIARNSKQDVLIYSLQASSIVDSIPLSGDPTALAIDTVHKEVYVCLYAQNLISVIDIEWNTVIATISISGRPWELLFSPGYEMAYVSELDNNSVGIIETSTHTLLDEISPYGLSHPKGMSITDNGDHLFVGSDYKVLVINTFDYSVEWNIDVGMYPYSAVFTPSFERLYIVCMDKRIFCIE